MKLSNGWWNEEPSSHCGISSRRGAVNSRSKGGPLQRLVQDDKVNVAITSADCTSEEGAIQLISEAHKLGAVGGIINSAAVLNDTLFEDLTPDSFDYIATSKVQRLPTTWTRYQGNTVQNLDSVHLLLVHFQQSRKSWSDKLQLWQQCDGISLQEEETGWSSCPCSGVGNHW